jgi:hypothetical protein
MSHFEQSGTLCCRNHFAFSVVGMAPIEIENLLDSLVERKKRQKEPCAFDGITHDLSHDILVAYVKFTNSIKRAPSRLESHECSPTCHPLFQHNKVFICPQSGNMHICTMELCQLKRVSKEDDRERCPLTLEAYQPVLICNVFDVDGGPTGSNYEFDDDYGCGEDRDGCATVSNILNGEKRVFSLPLARPPPQVKQEPLEHEKQPIVKVETTRKRKWTDPVPRSDWTAEKKAHRDSRKQQQQQQTDEVKATARRISKKGKARPGVFGSAIPGSVKLADVPLVRIRCQDQGEMTEGRLTGLGRKLIERAFSSTEVSAALPHEFVAWVIRIALILFAAAGKFPLRKQKNFSYVFEDHIYVVLLEMSCGLEIKGHTVVPRCSFVKKYLPTSKQVTAAGQRPRKRNNTRKYLKGLIASMPLKDIKELSLCIKRLGVFCEDTAPASAP